MLSLDLFPTKVYSKNCNLDLDDLYREIKKFQKNTDSVTISNRGGYQGHGFYYQPLEDLIIDSVPTKEDKDPINVKLQFWVNVNNKGEYNDIHDHNAYGGTFLSGVFYVKVPPNCGRLRLFDPRPFVTGAPDMKYYNDGNNYHYFDPEPNLMVIFPGWLKHDVEPNRSDEERISVAFNLVIKT
jgi:hypothetical protein